MDHPNLQIIEIKPVNLIELFGGSQKRGTKKMKDSKQKLLKTNAGKMSAFGSEQKLLKTNRL